MNLVPSDRKYKTIASIRKSDDYQILKRKIDLADFIFENKDSLDFTKIWEQILTYMNDTHNYELIFDILHHFALVRPKEIDLFSQLFNQFILHFYKGYNKCGKMYIGALV